MKRIKQKVVQDNVSLTNKKHSVEYIHIEKSLKTGGKHLINLIINNFDLNNQMGLQGKKYVEQNYDWNKIIKTFTENDEVVLLNGRWGPFLKIGKNNFKLPKDVEPEKLTLEECIDISENQPAANVLVSRFPQ